MSDDHGYDMLFNIIEIAVAIMIGVGIFSYVTHNCYPYSYYNDVSAPEYTEDSYMYYEDVEALPWKDFPKNEDGEGIDKIAYDPDIETLYISFHSYDDGYIFAFYPISKKDWNEIKSLSSVNKYYTNNIKGHYNCTAIISTDDISDKESVWPS